MTVSTGRVHADAPIGIFDSGVGGLSVWRAIRQALPGEDLLYLADSGHAPYGDRPAQWIQERTALLTRFLLDQGCKAIVIACNTATMVAAAFLRARFPIPIIAIEPAIKPAALISHSRSIALMATSRTVDSKGLDDLVRRHAADIELIRLPCPGLADRVEALQLGGPELEQALRTLLAPALQSQADTLVLGCTHYPFLRPTIETICAGRFQIIEPSFAVAAQVRRRLNDAHCLSARQQGGKNEFISSAESARASEIIRALSGLPQIHLRSLPELAQTSLPAHGINTAAARLAIHTSSTGTSWKIC